MSTWYQVVEGTGSYFPFVELKSVIVSSFVTNAVSSTKAMDEGESKFLGNLTAEATGPHPNMNTAPTMSVVTAALQLRDLVIVNTAPRNVQQHQYPQDQGRIKPLTTMRVPKLREYSNIGTIERTKHETIGSNGR